MADDLAVRVSGVGKTYGRLPVLRDVDLEVRPGTVFALLGPNGAGKTTMVRILATLVRPDTGEATVAGHDVVRSGPRVRRAISLTGQYAAVDELLTGRENLLMMGRLHHLPRAEARRRTAELLDRFELADAADRRVRTFSGGMRRKLDLAVSLIGRPAVLFLDEPTTGLDPRSRQAMWTVIGELVDTGVTVFLTTQYLEEADRLADRIAVLDGGRVIAGGTADELKRGIGTEQVELELADAAAVAGAVRALGAAVVRTEPDRHRIRVATDGSADDVRRVLDRLAADGVAVARIALHRPSLDDVFLTLTGSPAPAPDRAETRQLEASTP